MKNYGLKLGEKKAEDWLTLGASGVVNRPDSIWPLVTYEPQAENFETWGCTVWGSQNQVEMYIKEVFGVELNYWEQFNYNDVGINPPGSDPNLVYESIRKNGLIPQGDKKTPQTLEEFKTPRPPSSTQFNEAEKWAFTLNHWWLSDTSKESIIENLKRCPVALSVTAWNEVDGVYVSGNELNNHWCVAFAPAEYQGRKTIKVFDSYDHSVKILHPDHKIQVAKTIVINPKVTTEEAGIIGNIFSTLAQNGLFASFMDWWKKYVTKTVKPIESSPILPFIEPKPPEPIKVSNREKLKGEVLKWVGWDLSELVDNNLACAETFSRIIQKIYLDFPTLLSTIAIKQHFRIDKRFKATLDLKDWQVILCVTGTGNGKITHGHVGIIGENNLIYSNDSFSGKFSQNYTLQEWIDRYRVKGGFPIYVYDIT